MAFLVRDRVQETSTTTGTGTFTLNGAVNGYQSFGIAIGEGNATYYAIVNSTNPSEWEVGSGVIFGSSPDPITIARVVVYASSNSNAKVNFSSGTKQVFCTYAASRAVIRNTSGRVGIGTDDPLGTLEVTGVDASIMTRTFSSPPGVPQSAMQIGLGGTAAGAIGTGPSFLFFNNNSASTKTFLGRLTAIIEDPTAGAEKGGIALSVRQNGADSFANTEVVRITADSKVGVGTTVPSEKLDIVGNVKSNKIILNGSTSGSVTFDPPAVAGSTVITLPSTSGTLAKLTDIPAAQWTTSGSNIYYNSGKTSIGSTGFTSGAQGYLEVEGNSAEVRNLMATNNTAAGTGSVGFLAFKRNDTYTGGISQTGSATAYNTSSDYRLKDNVLPMTGALDKVALLKPVTYTWKLDGSSSEGFIAHELAEVCPNAVFGEKDAVHEDGSIKSQGIDTSFLVATLTAAIQELNAKFEKYKASHP